MEENRETTGSSDGGSQVFPGTTGNSRCFWVQPHARVILQTSILVNSQKRTSVRQLTFKNDEINSMRTITIDLPNSLDLNDKEARMILASKLYEMGKLSLGQAAEIAGYSKRTFMELLANYGVSIINHSPDELDQDLKNAQRYSL